MRALALFLAMTSPLLGQLGQNTYTRDTPIVIPHNEGDAVKVVRWTPIAEKHLLREKNRVILAAPPGQYIIVGAGNTVLQTIIILETGPAPEPIPDPKPNPEPSPEPEPSPDPTPEPEPDPDVVKIKIKRAVWLEELSNRAKHHDQTVTMFDPEVRKYLKERDIAVTVYDDDQAAAKGYRDAAKLYYDPEGELKQPLLFLVGESKTIIKPAPKTYDEIQAYIRKHAIR